jgi:hypothetical protein
LRVGVVVHGAHDGVWNVKGKYRRLCAVERDVVDYVIIMFLREPLTYDRK